MRLLRLSLQNWRGVDLCDVRFATGVTVIEGPNEIGKSTVVEALRMLFRELHSSNKKNVKAIQPVGEDIGSRVEVEMQAGESHFVYAKTFNKDRQTSLDILAPDKRQLTGREAHEAVEQLLAQSVDMVLWDALLVEQGKEVAPANLQSSTGLAQALDEAAGSSAAGVEDTDLFSAVQTEYEKYFTLKTARPRHAALEADLLAASEALAASGAALDAVEQDVADSDRCATEVRRLQAQLPALQSKVVEYEKAWQAVGSLRDNVTAKLNELRYAQAIHKSADDAHKQRIELIAEIGEHQRHLEAEEAAQAPLREQAEACRARLSTSQEALVALRQRLKEAQQGLNQAEGDARYAQDLEAVAHHKARLATLQQIADALRTHLQITTTISVDDAVVARFHEADARLATALEMRDAAATTVSITARRHLSVEFDNAPVSLNDGASHTRTVASELSLHLPGVADIRIVPSQSVAQLHERAQEAHSALCTLAVRHGVKDLAEAIAANQRRTDAQREVERLKGRMEDVLAQSSHEEVTLTMTSLQAQCERYLSQRAAGIDLPAGTAEARKRQDDARLALASAREALDSAQEQADALQREHGQIDGRLRHAQGELARLHAALTARRERLANDRKANPDDALQTTAVQAGAKVESLRVEADALQASLAGASPAAVEELLANARDVHARATLDLQSAKEQQAALSLSLQRAQADGRYDAFEAAQRKVEALTIELASTRRRAEAAARLWSTVSQHRNAAREAYVRPLKEAIERLGRIVFGAGFEISIGEDWSLVSRTMHGKTLPFEDLSVGAREQLGILARLAAAQIVARQGGVPLIIDDALGFADPSRLETMGAAIAAAGKQCQVIILTCTPGRFTNVGSAQVVRL